MNKHAFCTFTPGIYIMLCGNLTQPASVSRTQFPCLIMKGEEMNSSTRACVLPVRHYTKPFANTSTLVTPVLWGRHYYHPPHSADEENKALQDWNPVLSGTQSDAFGHSGSLPPSDMIWNRAVGPPTAVFLQVAKQHSWGTPQRSPSATHGSETVQSCKLKGNSERNTRCFNYDVCVSMCLYRCLCGYRWSKTNDDHRKADLCPPPCLQSKVD